MCKLDSYKRMYLNEGSLEHCACFMVLLAESNVDTGISGCSFNFWSATLAANESNGHLHVGIHAIYPATDRNVDCSSSVRAW